MTQHQIDREAVALWGCADGNGVDPRLIFRDRADALKAAAELGLTVQALYAAPEAVAWRWRWPDTNKWHYADYNLHPEAEEVQALAVIPIEGGEGRD